MELQLSRCFKYPNEIYFYVVNNVELNNSGKITVKGDGDLKKLRSAQILWIDNFPLLKFPRGIGFTFFGLRELRIRNCGIENISFADFKDCYWLRLLDLSDNNIMELPVDTFKHCVLLENLFLGGNLVMIIDVKMFDILRKLQSFTINTQYYKNLQIKEEREKMVLKLAEK